MIFEKHTNANMNKLLTLYEYISSVFQSRSFYAECTEKLTVFNTGKALVWEHHSCSKSGSIIVEASEKIAFVSISYQDVADNRLFTYNFQILGIFCFNVNLKQMKIIT